LSIWKVTPNLDVVNSFRKGTLVEHLDIVFTEFGDDFVKATMPVDHRTKQPMGLLHGGASAALAETMGSVASTLCVDALGNKQIVGLELNANHLKSTTSGSVTGTCKPIKIGRTIHVWQIDIHDTKGKHLCRSRLTVMVLTK